MANKEKKLGILLMMALTVVMMACSLKGTYKWETSDGIGAGERHADATRELQWAPESDPDGLCDRNGYLCRGSGGNAVHGNCGGHCRPACPLANYKRP